MMLYVLNRFLSVQDQSQHGTEQVLDLWARMGVDDAEFEILRSKMGKLAWEGFCKSRSEHYNELAMTKPKKVSTARLSRVKRVYNASSRVKDSQNSQRCQDCLPKLLHEAVTVVSWVEEARQAGVVQPISWPFSRVQIWAQAS
jgi:hypothetical protein